ncbi:MAG: GNAT family N-acetyltransferase [Anaerolineales bacterium]|nr:GNAT family N-acetyltransferase [Anaerolineales bacterium]
MADPHYRKLTLSDLKSMTQVLAQSFEDDPLVSFILPNKKTRIKTVAKFFRAMGRLNIQNNMAFGISDPLEGVAVWNFPDKSLSVKPKDFLTFIPLILSSYPYKAQKARPIFRQIEANHKKYADEPHFYLDNLGVLASSRGKGLSSKLIRPFLEMADSQKVIAYTDTVTKENVPLYEHFGFKCMEENHVSRTGITVYALRRSAR